MTTQKRISVKQYAIILVVCGLFEQITWLPELSLLNSPKDVIAAILLAAVLQAALFVPLYCFLRQNTKVQGAAGKAIAALYGLYFLAAAVYILFCGYLFLSRTVMPQTHGFVLLVLLLVSGCYVAARDTKAVVKTAAFFAMGSMIVIVLFFLLSLPQMEIAEIAFLPQNGGSVWTAAVHGALRSQIAPVLLVLAAPHAKGKERALLGSWVGIFTLFLAVGAAVSAVLGVAAQMVLFPPFVQITTVQVCGILQRMDVIWIAGWGMALLVVLGTLIHCGSACLKYAAGKVWFAAYLILAGGAAAVYHCTGTERVQNMLRQSWLIPLIQLFFCFLLPCLLCCARKFQQKCANTVQKGKK